MVSISRWAGVEGGLGRHVREQSERCLRAYRENPLLIAQDANIEIATAEGGYGRKQLYELVQNGADALQADLGRVAVVLTDDALMKEHRLELPFGFDPRRIGNLPG